VFGMGTGVTPPLWPPGNRVAADSGRASRSDTFSGRALDGNTAVRGAHVWGPSIPRGMACSRASLSKICQLNILQTVVFTRLHPRG
jgi:hypothetical protein